MLPPHVIALRGTSAVVTTYLCVARVNPIATSSKDLCTNDVDAPRFSFCWDAIQFRNAEFSVTVLISRKSSRIHVVSIKERVAVYVQFRLGLIVATFEPIRAQFVDLSCIDWHHDMV